MVGHRSDLNFMDDYYHCSSLLDYPTSIDADNLAEMVIRNRGGNCWICPLFS
jgi:hypothetical protein